MSMGMFNIGDNNFLRDIFGGYPEEKDFGQPSPTNPQTEAVVNRLKVLRTYVDGSAAVTQRAAPDLLAGLGAAAFELSDKVRAPNDANAEADLSLMPNPQALGPVAEQTIQDTLLAKVQALDETINHDTSSMGEANSVNNFKQALMLSRDLTKSGLAVDSKRNVALALKPLLENFRDTYARELRTLAAEMPEAQIANLEQVKLGAFKGLSGREIQYIEKFQRLQVTEEQLRSLTTVLSGPV